MQQGISLISSAVTGAVLCVVNYIEGRREETGTEATLCRNAVQFQAQKLLMVAEQTQKL